MVKNIKSIVWSVFCFFDSRFKFPNLKPGEIGIQLGFDMGASVTSDIFLMHRRVKPAGMVLGIDPDETNLKLAQDIIDRNNYTIKLIHKAVFSEAGEVELVFGEKPGWNQLTNIPIDSTVKYNGRSQVVPMDTLDNIITEQKIDVQNIGHVNVTINGSEYYALLGMENLLRTAKNFNLTVIAGRYDESGIVNGEPDYKIITNYLENLGFMVRFKRIHQLFWWGFMTKLIMGQTRVYGKDNYGVVMASKGDKRLKWYQSFS